VASRLASPVHRPGDVVRVGYRSFTEQYRLAFSTCHQTPLGSFCNPQPSCDSESMPIGLIEYSCWPSQHDMKDAVLERNEASPGRSVTSRESVLFALVLFALVLLGAHAQNAQPDLTELKIEDLMNVDVTSASKKEQKISRVPSAIFVITQEDIFRSGATNLPDLLRMVPGLEVAQINPSTWAISARGFNAQYSNKLLVLIDGRTVYTPLFSGVYWDAQDVPIDSIERIEVIRGPGATVWGANAVNGVINITTKLASGTQGGIATAEGGTLDHGAGMVRQTTGERSALVGHIARSQMGSKSDHSPLQITRMLRMIGTASTADSGSTKTSPLKIR
jgi:hypothetical protein